MRCDEFLNAYKELETALENKYSGKPRKSSSPVFEYINDDESKDFRETLDLCREIRNLISHNPKINGQSPLEPSESLVKFLKETKDFVERPVLAISFATKREDIFFAKQNANVLKTMAQMDQKGFSHVPVLKDGEFIGIFSYGTVFDYVLKSEKAIERATTLAQMSHFLPVNVHSENYKFADENLSLFDARKDFEKVITKNKRISVIFITKSGSPKERILAMLTPWDVMKDDV